MFTPIRLLLLVLLTFLGSSCAATRTVSYTYLDTAGYSDTVGYSAQAVSCPKKAITKEGRVRIRQKSRAKNWWVHKSIGTETRPQKRVKKRKWYYGWLVKKWTWAATSAPLRMSTTFYDSYGTPVDTKESSSTGSKGITHKHYSAFAGAPKYNRMPLKGVRSNGSGTAKYKSDSATHGECTAAGKVPPL